MRKKVSGSGVHGDVRRSAFPGEAAPTDSQLMPKIVDLKSTLNLPRTAFPMKASLPQNEPKQLAEWEEKKLYHRIQQSACRRSDLRPA